MYEKLENLEKHFKWLIRAKLVFKEEKNSDGKGRECEVKLSCPGPQIFAASNEESFEIAITLTIQDLEIQLNKRKSEMNTF